MNSMVQVFLWAIDNKGLDQEVCYCYRTRQFIAIHTFVAYFLNIPFRINFLLMTMPIIWLPPMRLCK
jgi:hypothetical protein